MMVDVLRWAPLCALFAGACHAEAPFAPSEPLGSPHVIYGADDRQEWFEVSDPAALAVADATAVVVSGQLMQSYANGDIGLSTSMTLQDYADVCTSEPFWDQPVPGDCTAFLVGEDLIATAGHCVAAGSCFNTFFAFGFRMEGPSNLRNRLPADDVYACDQVITRANTNTQDYALVRLDRPVVGHTPMPIRRSGMVSNGTPLLVASHPMGLPLKISTNATVRSNSATNYFEANVDVSEGSSGAPLVNANTGEVEGILVRGNDDFTWAGGCYVSNTCSNGGCPWWEEATRISFIASDIPPLGGGGTNPGGCADDALEQNDTASTAVPVTPGVYDLEICQADDDWYVVDVEAGDTVSVRIDFTHAAGDLDLELFDGNTLVGLSETIRNNEVLTYVAPADTTVGIRVYGYQAAANTYTLDVSVTAGVVPTLTLSGDTAPAVGSSYTWEMESDYANDSVVLVVGDPGGAINVPGCANTVLQASNIRVISATTTDAAGLADVTRVLPTGLAGRTKTFWAVSRDLCVVSEPLEVSFQ